MAEPDAREPLSARLLRLDFLAGVVVGIIALAILAQAWNLDMGVIRNFGPGFLPKVLGLILAAGAAILIIWGLTQPADYAERVQLKWRGPAMVAAGVFFFALFIRPWSIGAIPTPQLGLLVVAPVTVVLAGFGSKEADIRELLVLGFGLTGLATMLFSDILGLQIPVFPRFVEIPLTNSFGYDWPKRVAYLVYFALCLGLFRQFGFRFSSGAARSGGEQ